MKKHILFLSLLTVIIGISFQNSSAQNIPSVAELRTHLTNSNYLVTYRECEAVYGTYFYLDIHYCPNGYFVLFGRSVKQTVLGNEQYNNWQEYGTWKVIDLSGQVGIHYITTTGQQNFVPVYQHPNGGLFIGQGISIVKQGFA